MKQLEGASLQNSWASSNKPSTRLAKPSKAIIVFAIMLVSIAYTFGRNVTIVVGVAAVELGSRRLKPQHEPVQG